MNSDLRDWLRERTSAWISEPARHCLSDRYQVFEGTWPVAGIPAFLEDLRPIENIAPTAPWRNASTESQGDVGQRRERYETLLQRKMEVIRETRNEFAGLLRNQGESQGDPVDGQRLEDLREEHQAYDLLSNREETLKRRVEQLADTIDEEFGTTQPST